MRGFSALVLACLLAWTAVAYGAARGQARVAGEVVLCLGGVTAEVAVDSRGQPVGPVHICPDCVLFALGSVGPEPVEAVRPLSWPRRSGMAVRQAIPVVSQWRGTLSARGPPLARALRAA